MLTMAEIQENIYIKKIITKYTPQLTIFSNPTLLAANQVKVILEQWAGQHLIEVRPSGSYAKNTAVLGSSDVDLFISLKSTTTSLLNMNLRDIYYNLDAYMQGKGYQTRQQNVSIGVAHNNIKIDLVPAVRQTALTFDHSIYRRKADTWTKTNITKHINTVKTSNRTEDIRAIKIWRNLHGLEFPSLYLELTVINALSGYGADQPGKHFRTVLNYIVDKLLVRAVTDPANTGNTISDELTREEKQTIIQQAQNSLAEGYWENIIW